MLSKRSLVGSSTGTNTQELVVSIVPSLDKLSSVKLSLETRYFIPELFKHTSVYLYLTLNFAVLHTMQSTEIGKKCCLAWIMEKNTNFYVKK